QKGQQLDGGIQTGEESTGVEGDQARNGSVGAWSGVGIARSCGALTPVALRAPSVSAPQDLLTLLRRGTSYFALTGSQTGSQTGARHKSGKLWASLETRGRML